MKLVTTKRIPSLANLGKQEALNLIRQHLIEIVSEGTTLDAVLELALDAMALLFVLDKNYRKNIYGFRASYAFKTADGTVDVSAVFKCWRFLFWQFPSMTVKASAVPRPDVAIEFQGSREMATFVLAENPDIFIGILNNGLALSGNINYILKFVYMTRHILEVLGIPRLQ